MKLRPCGSPEPARRDHVSLHVESVFISITNNIHSRPTQLDPGLRAEGMFAVEAAFDSQAEQLRRSSQQPSFLTYQLLPSFLKSHLFPGHLVLFNSPASWSMCSCANAPLVSLWLSIFCWILLQVLGFLGPIVLHYFLFPVAFQIYLVCY